MLKERDPEIAQALDREIDRQRGNIVLIASENYASGPVLEMLGSPLTNKYAEGYPGKRYYGGCQFVDIGEQLAIDRAKELYGAEHANVQPHSGAQANMAAYFALLKPGDTVLGMRLDQGGHLTHGSPVNFSGVLYNFVSYGVDRESELLDYDEIERLAKEHRPTLIVAGATAYPSHDRLRPLPRYRRRGGCTAHGGHGASRGHHRRGAPSLAHTPRRRGHVVHAQDAARAAGRYDSVERQV